MPGQNSRNRTSPPVPVELAGLFTRPGTIRAHRKPGISEQAGLPTNFRDPLIRSFTVTNLGTHSALLATDFASSFSGFLRSHAPGVSD